MIWPPYKANTIWKVSHATVLIKSKEIIYIFLKRVVVFKLYGIFGQVNRNRSIHPFLHHNFHYNNDKNLLVKWKPPDSDIRTCQIALTNRVDKLLDWWHKLILTSHRDQRIVSSQCRIPFHSETYGSKSILISKPKYSITGGCRYLPLSNGLLGLMDCCGFVNKVSGQLIWPRFGRRNTHKS